MSNKPIPPRIHVLAKPSGATCNLACSYCFFLDKELLYPDSKFRMSEDVLENYIRQLIETHRSSEITVGWQGGEPTAARYDLAACKLAYDQGTWNALQYALLLSIEAFMPKFPYLMGA